MKIHVNLSLEYEVYLESKKKIKNFSKFFERVLISYNKNHKNEEVQQISLISDEDLLKMLEED